MKALYKLNPDMTVRDLGPCRRCGDGTTALRAFPRVVDYVKKSTGFRISIPCRCPLCGTRYIIGMGVHGSLMLYMPES